MTKRATPPVIRWAQISLKWSAEGTDVAAYLMRAVATLELDGFSCTEGAGKAAVVRRALGAEWRVQARGEFLIATRRAVLSRYPLLPFARYRIAPGADWSNGPHAGTRHFAALFGNYRVRATGSRLRAAVTHAPSHVQVGTHWRALPHRVLAYSRGMSWLGKQVGHMRHDVGQLVCMDSNLEQHLHVWRTYLERTLGLPSIYSTELPNQGTEGRRLIDTAHTNLPVSNVRVVKLHRAPVLDHDLIVFDVQAVA